MAVLPPIAASTWPTSVVGTATQGTPRRKVAAANPATSVVQPPPSATIVPSRSSRSARQSRSSDGDRLRLLAAGLVHATSRSPSASCASTPWMPGDVRVGDERDGAVAGHELAEPVERAGPDVDARGGEDDAVGVVRDRVGDPS